MFFLRRNKHVSSVGPLQDLRDVLRIKETFYRSGFSHYDRCIAGGLPL